MTNVTRIRLGPKAAVDQISPLLDDLSCTYESRADLAIGRRTGGYLDVQVKE